MPSRKVARDPYYSIKFNGKPFPSNLLKYVSDVMVDESDDKATLGKISFTDPEEILLNNPNLLENTPIEIKMGHLEGGKRVMLDGRIKLVEVSYPQVGVPNVTIVAIDKSKVMSTTKRERTWNNVKKSDVVRQIAKGYGFKVFVESTSLKVETITQNNETDIQFVRRLAEEENFTVEVTANNEFHFRPRFKRKNPIATLYYGIGNYDIKSFDPSFVEQEYEKRIDTSEIDLDTHRVTRVSRGFAPEGGNLNTVKGQERNRR